MADTRWQDGAAPIRYPDPDIKVLDPRFQRYVLGNTAVERIAGGGRFTRDRYGSSDIPNDRIMKWEEATGQISLYAARRITRMAIPATGKDGSSPARWGRSA